jgi:pyruvate ferredoxin oxidoreductase gamma subunit
MYRIRFHGRGGHGMKTASRILGSALFAEGFEVQDAPRYGAERRGAPIFAYVRASRKPIHERGVIVRPDLVVVADDTLVRVASAGVLSGVDARTVMLIASVDPAEAWKARLRLAGPVVALPGEATTSGELRFVGAACAAGAARLLGVVSRDALEAAVRDELAGMAPDVVAANVERALAVFDDLDPAGGPVVEGPDAAAATDERPDWIELPFDDARISAPDVRAAATSVEVRTGLWRTMRPVIDRDRCHHCHWICSTFCPDGAILVDDGENPRIDLDHCKGCMLCVAVCPPHAIHAIPEVEARAADEEAAT